MGKVEVKPDRWQMATAIASLLSVLAVGIGLIVTNNYNRAQQQLTLQGQITDRFTKAVEQLGQPGPQRIDVRLGAIYALQRIMRDSTDDQAAVVDILSAFVRVHAPARPSAQKRSVAEKPLPPPVDTQAALTVLARRDPIHDAEGRVDLSRTNLRGAAMPSASMRGANLTRADLLGADLDGANLSGGNLIWADLFDADLSKADLTGAKLDFADLSEANLSDADLSGASLQTADLRDVNLSGANLSGANLSGARLSPGQLRCTTVGEGTALWPKVDGGLVPGTPLPHCEGVT